jgi:predicted nucleic acid-binding protein
VAVVVDANLIVTLAVRNDLAPSVLNLIQQWIEESESMHAPDLLHYEVANAITRLIVAGDVPAERIDTAWQIARGVPITFHSMAEFGPQIISMALRLRRQSAHDAAYLALAIELNAELWTLDGPLARNADSIGLPIHLVQ